MALQITKPARKARLVEEKQKGEATYMADVRVYAFDGFLLVGDRDKVDDGHIAELVRSAVGDRNSIHRAMNSKVMPSGHGYMIQLPCAEDAGFEVGETAPVGVDKSARGVLCISRDSRDHLIEDLLTIRREQIR